MTQRNKTYLWWVIGIIIVIALLWWAKNQQNQSGVTEEPIKIGYIGALTGDVALWGTIEKNVVNLLVDEINAQGGINGRQIRATYEDGKCLAKEAATAARKLTEVDGVKIILPMCSSETLTVGPIVAAKQGIIITSATNPDVSKLGRYVFRVSYSDKDIGRVAAETISKQTKKAGIIFENTSYATGLKDAFVQEFEARGGQVTIEGFPQGSKETRSQITKLIGQGVEAIFVDSDGVGTGVAVLKQLRESGFKGQVYGNYFGDVDEVVQSAEAQNMIFFSNPLVPEGSAKQAFFERYKARYGSYPDLEFVAAQRYDAVMVLKQAIEAVGDDPAKISEYLHRMPPFTGLLGTFQFDENGDISGIVPAVKQIKDRQVVSY